MDAVIRRGASDLNESVLTGESVPVEKKEGEELFAGTVNGRGLLIAEATRPLSESTYARILRRVEEAQARKSSRADVHGAVRRRVYPGGSVHGRPCGRGPFPAGPWPRTRLGVQGARDARDRLPVRDRPRRPRGHPLRPHARDPGGDPRQGRKAPGSDGDDPGGGVRQDRHAHAGKAPGNPGAGGERVDGGGGSPAGGCGRGGLGPPRRGGDPSGGGRGGAWPRRRGGPSPGRSSPWKGKALPPRWRGGRSSSGTGGCSRRWGLAATRSTGSSKTGGARRRRSRSSECGTPLPGR